MPAPFNSTGDAVTGTIKQCLQSNIVLFPSQTAVAPADTISSLQDSRASLLQTLGELTHLCHVINKLRALAVASQEVLDRSKLEADAREHPTLSQNQ